MKLLQVLPGLIALALFAACSGSTEATTPTAPPSHDAVDLASKAETGAIHSTATLASIGTFEYETAAVTNHAADLLILVPLQLKKHEITKTQAQSRIDTADKAHTLVQQAIATCKANKKGKCRGNEAKAHLLLDQAKTQLAGL